MRRAAKKAGLSCGLLTLMLLFQPAFASTGCNDSPHPLAFWLGHWDVYAEGKLDGHSYIESALDGCAVIEHWDDVSKMHGMSLFYFEPHTAQWKQVWVTDHATVPGGLKEKTMIFAESGQVRF